MFAAYATAKTALVRFTETLAIETAGYGIRVNAVAPGAFALNEINYTPHPEERPEGAPRRTRAATAASLSSRRAGVGFHVVLHLYFAVDDILLSLLDLGLHFRGDQIFVVLVDGPVDAAFFEPQHANAGLPGAIDALDHRGQHRAGLQIVLVGIDAD